MIPAKNLLLASLIVLLAAGASFAADTKIKKCRDARGEWHYGNTAAEECAQSKIIELDKFGVKRKVIDAPLTEEELKQRALGQEEQKRQAEQAKRDETLLATYGHEDDIIYVRDRKLAQIESSIKATEDTMIPLRAALARMQAQAADEQKSGAASEQTTKNIAQTEAQIAKHEAAVAAKRKEQETLRAQYAADLERYRELKRERVEAQPTSKK